ncbi:MAG: hypothetical protein ABEI52_05715, partial [Halobacteriaceae archaeon]
GESVVGSQYVVLGDGNVGLAQAESGTPVVLEVEERDQGYAVTFRTFTSADGGMGAMFTPFINGASEFYLSSGVVDTFQLDPDEMASILFMEELPIRYDDEFCWSSELLERLF